MQIFDFPPDKKLTDNELIQIFGAEDLAEIHKDKIFEETNHLNWLRVQFRRKSDYINSHQFPEEWRRAYWQNYLKRTVGTEINLSKRQLKKYLRVYTKAIKALPIQQIKYPRRGVITRA